MTGMTSSPSSCNVSVSLTGTGSRKLKSTSSYLKSWILNLGFSQARIQDFAQERVTAEMGPNGSLKEPKNDLRVCKYSAIVEKRLINNIIQLIISENASFSVGLSEHIEKHVCTWLPLKFVNIIENHVFPLCTPLAFANDNFSDRFPYRLVFPKPQAFLHWCVCAPVWRSRSGAHGPTAKHPGPGSIEGRLSSASDGPLRSGLHKRYSYI